MKVIKAKFKPGHITATPGFMEKCNRAYALGALERHLSGDWGLVDCEDWDENNKAVSRRLRLFSVYPLPDEAGNFWIITEADRSVTTFLLPEEY